MSTGLALTSRTLLEDDFANDTSVDPGIWSPSPSGPAEFIPSMNGGPGTELAPNLPGIANGALDLTLQTFNPHSRQPEDSFYGSEVVSNQSFDNGASGIAFTAVARLGTTQPGMDGGIFPFHNDSSTGLSNEIDFESFTDVAANANNQEQTNVYVNAVPNTVGSPVQVADPSLTAYQTYTIEWFRNEVLWFIDGQLVRVSTAVPQGPLQFYLNFWASDPGGALQPTDQAHNQTYDFYVQSANVSAIQDNPVRLGDFNGDKSSDLLWFDGSTFTEWQATANGFTPNVDIGSVGAGWYLAGVDDFSGDGKADLIWQNGANFTEWQSTGNGFTPNVYVGSVGSGWLLAATGHFTGNASADLIWQNGGTFTLWQSNGNGFTPNVYVGSVGSGWNLAGTGDFTGDGKSDLIWQNGGTFTEWQSTGNGFTPNVFVSSLGAGWSLAAVGDFNGDGKDDLLFRNTNGTFTEWQSTGNGFTPNVLINSSVGNTWALEYAANGPAGAVTG